MSFIMQGVCRSISQPLFLACWCWICSCFFLFHGGPVTSALNIGAVINPNLQDGIKQMIAIEVTAKQLNSSALPIFLNIRDSATMGPAVIVEDLIDEWQADVVLVGIGTWTDETIIAEVRNEKQVPMISFPPTTVAQSSSTRVPSRPWLSHLPGKFFKQVQCVADFVGSYNWRRVIVIYEEDAIGTITVDGISHLSNSLRSVRSDIQRIVSFKRHETYLDPKETIREALTELKEDICRVFVLIQASREFSNDLFQEAKALDMMIEGYVWLFVNNDMQVDNTRTSLAYKKGVVEVRNYVNQSDPAYSKFLDEFQRRFRSIYGEEQPNLDPGIYAFLMYDAVHVTSLMPTSRVNYQGLTAHIGVGDKGEILTSGTMFTVTNTVGNGYREMGFWSKGIGFHENDVVTNTPKQTKADQVFGPVYWPGGPTWVPGGWDLLHVIAPAKTTFDEFIRVVSSGNGEQTKVTGFSIDMFEEALKKMPYTLRVKYHPYNGTYDCLVEMVRYSNKKGLIPYNGTEDCKKDIDNSTQRYDAAVGDITILGYRSKIVDFTVPYMETGLYKIVRARRYSKAFIFLEPFTWRMWSATALASLYTGIIIWLLERDSNSEEYKSNSWKHVANGFWFTYLTFFSSQGKPYSNFAKVALLMWLFTTMIITQSYTACLSSILTVQRLHPVNTSENEQVGCDGDSFVVNYLQKVLPYEQKDIHKIDSIDEYPKAFENGNITSAYLELPYLVVFLSKYGDDFTITGESDKLAGLGFAFDKGSPLTADISTAILEMIDDGKMKQLTKKWFKVDLLNYRNVDPNTNTDNLDIDNFWFLFVLSGGTSTIVLIFFLLSMSRKYRRDHRTQARISPEDRVSTTPQPPRDEHDHGTTGLEGLDDGGGSYTIHFRQEPQAMYLDQFHPSSGGRHQRLYSV